MLQICQRIGRYLANADSCRNHTVVRLVSSYYRDDRKKSDRYFQQKEDTVPDDNFSTPHENDNPIDNRPLFQQEDPNYAKSKKHKYKSRNSEQFKAETVPNLLLWEQKEKIKSLYQEDPEAWPINRLSGNFPASIATIKKILRSKWEPDDVTVHDDRAKKHWRQLLNGEFEVSPGMMRHLLSFLPKELQQQQQQQKGSLLTSSNEDTDETNVAGKEDSVQQNEDKQISTQPFKCKTIAKYDIKKVAVKTEKPHYDLRIKIPQEKWKEGATYKVGDVYYHSDGTFLYRVPGLN